MQADPGAIAVGLILTLTLAAISFAVVEQSVRSGLQRYGNVFSIVALASIVAVAGFASRYSSRHAGDRQLPEQVAVAEQALYDWNPQREKCLLFAGLDMPRCRYGNEAGSLAVILYGDSHANAIATAVAAALPNRDSYVEEWSYASCPSIFGATLKGNDRPCTEFNEWAKTELTKLPANIPVIIANRFSSYPLGDEDMAGPQIHFEQETGPTFLDDYEQHFVSTICEISKSRQVFLMRPVPEMPYDVPTFLARSLMLRDNVVAGVPRSDYDTRHSFVFGVQDEAAKQCGAKILDTPQYLCDGATCPANGDDGIYYFDGSHLSEVGNKRLTPMFSQVFSAP